MLDDVIGVDAFLRDYPSMGLRPSADSRLRLEGRFAFAATHETQGDVEDVFSLQIDVPHEFPRDLPVVREVGGRIPHVEDYHVNPDGTLCLGSPLSLLLRISEASTLTGFAENCVVPYLFAVSRKLKNGGPLVFGELAHGAPGLLSDYQMIFGLRNHEAVKKTLKYLGMKKRRANKLPCPCGCGIRLGRCRFNFQVREFRMLSGRTWFRRQYRES